MGQNLTEAFNEGRKARAHDVNPYLATSANWEAFAAGVAFDQWKGLSREAFSRCTSGRGSRVNVVYVDHFGTDKMRRAIYSIDIEPDLSPVVTLIEDEDYSR